MRNRPGLRNRGGERQLNGSNPGNYVVSLAALVNRAATWDSLTTQRVMAQRAPARSILKSSPHFWSAVGLNHERRRASRPCRRAADGRRRPAQQRRLARALPGSRRRGSPPVDQERQQGRRPRRDLLQPRMRRGRHPEGHRGGRRSRAARRPAIIANSPTRTVPDQGKLDWLMKQLQSIAGTVVATYLRDVRGVDLPTDGHPPLSTGQPTQVSLAVYGRHHHPFRSTPPGVVACTSLGSRSMARARPPSQGPAALLPRGLSRSRTASSGCATMPTSLCGSAWAKASRQHWRYDHLPPRRRPLRAGVGSVERDQPLPLAVPHGIETLVVYADRGQAGETAADMLGASDG